MVEPLPVSSVAGLGLAAFAALMLSIQAVCVRLATAGEGKVNAVVATAIGMNVLLITGGTALVYYPEYGLTPLSLAVFVAAGFSSTVFARALYYMSIDRIGASRSEPLKASQPLHASLVAVVVLGEVVTGPHLVGILLIVVGVAVISWETSRRDASVEEVDLYELALPLGAAFFWGIEPTFAKLGFAEGTPVFVGLAVKALAAGIGFSLYLLWRHAVPTLDDFRGPYGRWYVAAGLANTGFLVAYFFALNAAPVVLVVPIVQSSPLLVLVLSFLFLGRLERVTWRLVAAALVVTAGAIAVSVFA